MRTHLRNHSPERNTENTPQDDARQACLLSYLSCNIALQLPDRATGRKNKKRKGKKKKEIKGIKLRMEEVIWVLQTRDLAPLTPTVLVLSLASLTLWTQQSFFPHNNLGHFSTGRSCSYRPWHRTWTYSSLTTEGSFNPQAKVSLSLVIWLLPTQPGHCGFVLQNPQPLLLMAGQTVRSISNPSSTTSAPLNL